MTYILIRSSPFSYFQGSQKQKLSKLGKLL